MQTTQQFIDGCLAYYRENDVDLNDPDNGPIDKAHHPIPRHRGGRLVVSLQRHHHAIHNVLQSNEVGTPCVFHWEKQAILQGPFVAGWFDLLDDFDRWRSQHAREAAKALHSRKTKAGKSAHAIKAALIRHHG